MPPEGSGGTAWRVWAVRADGALTHCFVTAVESVWTRWGNVATCRHQHHVAPAERCLCGLHVLLDEAELWSFVRHRHRGSPWAAGRVMYGGAVMRSHVRNDPPSTRRVERASLMGPLILSPLARPYADAVAERYALPVVLDGWGGHVRGGGGESRSCRRKRKPL